MKVRFSILLLSLPVLLAVLWGFSYEESRLEPTRPLYINDIALYGDKLLTAERCDNTVSLYSRDGRNRLMSWHVAEPPTGVVSDGELIYVTTSFAKGGVEVINPKSDSPVKFIPTGRGACSPILSADGKFLYVCNQFQTTISEIDLATMVVTREVKVLREPKNAVLSKDGHHLFVANFLPVGRANQDYVAGAVSVIDMQSFEKIKDVPLATGSNALRGMAISCDGEYLFITHNLGRFQIPTSQLQQGWMNTSAVSVISAKDFSYGGAVLLDEVDRGAAGVWNVKCTADKMVVSHSGTHEISIIDYPAFVEKYKQVADKESLSYDLKFVVGLRQRIALRGNGPRNFVIADNSAYIPTFFSDTLNVIDLDNPAEISCAALVENRQESDIDKGEKYFNDASYCFQNWQSCNGCHPGDGRTDGLNWDNLNDGTGNPKNCKSMMVAHYTAPSMISGIREHAEKAVRAGFKYIQFNEVSEDIATCVDEYLKNLKPVPSPYLVNGELSGKAQRGRIVYQKYGCGMCHSGPYYTDCKMHVIGEDVEFKQGWDTPTLVEVWRTAPYLFDGRAATMEEVFTVHRHGLNKKSKITSEEIDDLVEYVNSL
ncbi:MAG: YVTN family beta-propeller repeat-containing protein [Alistipes sp.]|nr:YVTN family beta-propeller repeat-containing protein [Alistipes sp.]